MMALRTSRTAHAAGGWAGVFGGARLRRLIVGVALAGVALLGQPAAGQGLEELRVRFPDVKAYHPHGRVLTVWGTPMTRGETPREAADEWVFWHGDVFGSAGGLDLEEFREVKLRRAAEGKERRVFMYQQTMDMDGRAEPLAVVGSSFRVLTEGDPDSGPAEVVYVAGRVATRPAGGLPAPVVTPAEALAAAKAHERGRGLETWGEPELVAIYEDEPVGDGVAQAAWRMRGAGESPLDSRTFYVDAASGVVVREHSSVAHFADEVQGSVSGYASPGTQPDIPSSIASNPSSPWYGCGNPAMDGALPDVWVTAYLEETSTLVDSGWTDENGDYELDVDPGDFPVDVYFELKGPGWVVHDMHGVSWPGSAVARLAYSGNPVAAAATGVDVTFNPSPTEYLTAAVNAHKAVSRVWRWLDFDLSSLPELKVVANYDLAACGAFYGEVSPIYAITFAERGNACANTAYSTVVAHEVCHFLHNEFAGIDRGGEGFCDALGLLVFETEYAGHDFFGCDDHFRYPREPGLNHTWPVCPPVPPASPQCSMGKAWSGYCPGELLSALWLDMLDEFHTTPTRDLFVDWMMVALPVPAAYCGNNPIGQEAGPTTLIEVLQVADENDYEAICFIFTERDIDHPDPTPNPCEESAGGFCYADCDGNAVLSFWDFLCYQNTFVAGVSYADCDADGELTFFDFLCFQNEFVSGCP